MRGLVVALLCFACHTDAPASDAGGDGAQPSFEQPIGSGCDADESLLCARGAGVCHKGVCCAFCNAAGVPHCPDGMMEIHQTSGNRDLCLCATE
jgi:hypothetical protein